VTDTRDRTNAINALQATQNEINNIPEGRVHTDIVMAGSQKAQVFALAAVAHALLDVADAIRETRQDGTP
jgi:hypothetical protein